MGNNNITLRGLQQILVGDFTVDVYRQGKPCDFNDRKYLFSVSLGTDSALEFVCDSVADAPIAFLWENRCKSGLCVQVLIEED